MSSECARASDLRATRIEINRNISAADFGSWLPERLAIRPGEDVLNVGSGTAAQAIPFAGLVGSLSSLDICAASTANRFDYPPASVSPLAGHGCLA